MKKRETHTKLQRWTDLIAALLVRRLGGSFDELARDVPAYGFGKDAKQRDSIKRTFERDKDELRAFGIPIETVSADGDEETRYRLRAADFYLPYLTLGGLAPRVRSEGYRSLPTLTLTPDDLALVSEAAARLDQLGDPTLSADVRQAVNKLAFDLPVFGRTDSDVSFLDHGADDDPGKFAQLNDALNRRKIVTFQYQKPSADGATERRVEPFGLFFISAHWYLAGRDRSRDALRSFRLSRMSDIDVNAKRPQTPDFDVPADFDLRRQAQAKDSWELGDTEATSAVVRFANSTGAVEAAAKLGDPVAGKKRDRTFSVRRMDTFARWLVSFGGDATPVSPPELKQAYNKIVRETLAKYGSDA